MHHWAVWYLFSNILSAFYLHFRALRNHPTNPPKMGDIIAYFCVVLLVGLPVALMMFWRFVLTSLWDEL